MANRSLNIRKPQTLRIRLDALESQTIREAQSSHSTERVQHSLRINGSEVSFTVTPSIKPGRYYRLFRINGKRTPKENVSQHLLASVS